MTHNAALHPLFEFLSYTVAFQFFRSQKKGSPTADFDTLIWIVIGAIFGALIGSKIAAWLENPVAALANFPSLALWNGKSVVGGLLGGVIGVERAKKHIGLRASTGDAMAFAMLLGIMIGRVGCFVAGLPDQTHGNPTKGWWSYDFGDGIPRHPTQLYEIAFLSIFWLWLMAIRPRLRQSGDLFALTLSGYLLWRLLIEFIKPMPQVYFGALSGIGLCCVLGLVYYTPRLWRIRAALYSRTL
jgi:phosphatidylglycerol---prolipoprotein diacylglyceryl transferase